MGSSGSCNMVQLCREKEVACMGMFVIVSFYEFSSHHEVSERFLSERGVRDAWRY